MRIRSHAWSMDPKAFRKSMYARIMYLLVNIASSRVVIIVWIYLDVLCCGRNPSWLKCSSFCRFS